MIPAPAPAWPPAIAGRERRAAERVQLALERPAGVQREEVDARRERRRVLVRADRVQHHREVGHAVEQHGAGWSADRRLRVGRDARGAEVDGRRRLLAVLRDRLHPDAVGGARVECDQRGDLAVAADADRRPHRRDAEVDEAVRDLHVRRERSCCQVTVAPKAATDACAQVRDLEASAGPASSPRPAAAGRRRRERGAVDRVVS